MSYTVAKFKISDSNLSKFKTWVKKPKDCIINALQLLNILSARNADICRILVGDRGVSKDQLEEIFSLIYSDKNWNFYKFTNISTLKKITREDMAPGSAIFCGFKYPSGDGHVFLIGKGLDSKVYYIDPQIPTVCDLDSKCKELFAYKPSYYILQFSEKQ